MSLIASDPCLMAIRYELHTVVAELQRNRANWFYSTDLPTDLKPCTQRWLSRLVQQIRCKWNAGTLYSVSWIMTPTQVNKQILDESIDPDWHTGESPSMLRYSTKFIVLAFLRLIILTSLLLIARLTSRKGMQKEKARGERSVMFAAKIYWYETITKQHTA